MLAIDIITIFPDIFKNFTDFGVIREAFSGDRCILNIFDLRDFSNDKHRKVDGRPYGGGPGMVLMPEPVYRAVRFIKNKNRIKDTKKQKVILLTPRGKQLQQKDLHILTGLENIILICGRYEGIDERVIRLVVDLEISIGDYILAGGEVPAMVIIEGILRLLPGVLGRAESLEKESFENNFLDYPQYTRPPVFNRMGVPEVLLSGNHKKIENWRESESHKITQKMRPDLIDKSK